MLSYNDDMNGNTNPDNKIRRAIIAHHGCCDAKGGARCKARKTTKGRKGKGTK